MKKVILSVAALAALGILLVSWKSSSSEGGGANLFTDDACQMVVCSHNGGGTIDLVNDRYAWGELHEVYTPSGNILMTCKSDTRGMGLGYKSAKHLDISNAGYDCNDVQVSNGGRNMHTVDWHTVVSPGGNATLVCEFQPE